jgi:hypothetical protein
MCKPHEKGNPRILVYLHRSYILKPYKKANASKVARIQIEHLNSL